MKASILKLILALYALPWLLTVSAFSQQIQFNLATQNKSSEWGSIIDIAQDAQGYIWFTTQRAGLFKYDGNSFVNYRHDPHNANSLAGRAGCLAADASDIIWIGTINGLDKFDLSTNTFTHFRHDPKDSTSLSSDTVFTILNDRSGDLWVGTTRGLNLFDKKTGKFTRYINKPGDEETISNNLVAVLYEDRQGTLWAGCGSPSALDGGSPADGGLNRFNKATGKFTRYLHNPADPNSIANNKVFAISEDSKGNFWIGTAGDGLHTMDRDKGTFTHYYYDAAQPGNLSRPPLNNDIPQIQDHIRFIREDATGAIWIGSFACGINRFDPLTKKLTHYGHITKGSSLKKILSDTTAGFKDLVTSQGFLSRDGLLWIATYDGNLYNVNPHRTSIPYYTINTEANSFYYNADSNVLWIGTGKGLVRKELNTNKQQTWQHQPSNNNSLSNDAIHAMEVDGEGKFWLATFGGGVCRFDPVTSSFVSWQHNENDNNSVSSNYVINLSFDHYRNLWIATNGQGLDQMNIKTGTFNHYRHDDKDSNSLSSDLVFCITEDQYNELWIGTYGGGLNRLTNANANGPGKEAKFRHYLPSSYITSIYVDAEGILWVGAVEGLYYFDRADDRFLSFADPNSREEINGVLHILEDNKKNLWVSTIRAIVKLNKERNGVKRYGENYGVRTSTFVYADNHKAKNGQLFLGDQNGYYAFFPDQLKDNDILPQVSFTGFKLKDEEVKLTKGGVLQSPVWKTKAIQLGHDQNTFSLDFIAVHYDSPGELKYLFMLENYDDTWHSIGNDHRAYFFNVPPGNYIFHAKAVNSDGTWGEKTISILITPPWWRTWWAYCIYGLGFIALAFLVHRYQKARVLKTEREKSRIKELAQAKEIEKAYHKLEETHEALKATQKQLIHQEKMASLGELTAGIAHEIKNPLNFINNFSEINKEMIAELQEEIDKGNYDEVKLIANNIGDNEEKINHHGKRADAIVKGMLQHSRASVGQKELTNINALADEYLRLAWHGLRAKDKLFDAEIKTDFDNSIGQTNVVPQDIARMFVNLFNNAFYAVTEKKKIAADHYLPTVFVQTKKLNDKIEIKVEDNGNGIPQKIIDKIFQPFFTTKPTGQGTGLGLSLAYDIIKAHHGEIKAESKEGEWSVFTVQLPVNP